MKEQFDLIGPEKFSEEYRKAQEALGGFQKEGLKKIEGEYEKSEEEIKFIDKINSYFNEELEEIGVKRRVDCQPDRIHLLPDKIFKEKFSRKVRALQRSHEDNIYLNKDDFDGRISLYKSMAHEMLHNLSFVKYHADTKKKSIDFYRGGYQVSNTKEENHEHFRGLTEAVTDKTLQEIFRKNGNELINEFNISEEEQQEPIYWHDENVAILDAIIEKIAEKKNEKKEDVWGRFKRGLFTGEMMHLKDVDKVFGRGSLRVLAALDSRGSAKNLPPGEIDNKILKYFKTDNEKEKRKIAMSILSERERIQFLKNNQNKKSAK